MREMILRQRAKESKRGVCYYNVWKKWKLSEGGETLYCQSDTDPNNESNRDSRGWQADRENEWGGWPWWTKRRTWPHLNSCYSPERCTSAPNSTGSPAMRGWGLSQRFLFTHTYIHTHTHSWALCSKQPGDVLSKAHAMGQEAVTTRGLEFCLTLLHLNHELWFKYSAAKLMIFGFLLH